MIHLRPLLALAARSALNRRLTLVMTTLAIALSVTLLLGIERLREGAHEGFSQSVSGTDLIVGARGSPVQLLLYSVFHIGNATNNMRWQSFDDLSRHPAVAWAVPLSLGDSHRSHAVLGTTPAYFEHFRHGNQTPLAFTAGRPFGAVFEAVIGAEVAEQLGYRPGQTIALNHGMADTGLASHADKPFTVVGILAATGTPVDRSILVGLDSIEAIHLDWQGGAPIPGVVIPPQFVSKFNLQPKTITAALVGLKTRIDVFRMQRYVADYRPEPLVAVLPGVALDELWQVVGLAEKALLAVSAMVVLVGLAGLVAVILASLNERRRELAILRAVGARPRELFLLLSLEGVLVTLLGLLGGVILASLLGLVLAPLAQARYGILLPQRLPSTDELSLLGLVVCASLLACIAPGWRAYRLSLADGLTPRI